MKPRLVVFEFHHLGDAVIAIPFLRGALTRFEVIVCCGPSVAVLLCHLLPELDCRPCASLFEAIGFVRALRLGPSDATACVWADARMEILAAASGAGLRVGFPMNRANYYAAHLPWRWRRMMAGQVLGGLARALGGLSPALRRGCANQSHAACWDQIASALHIETNATLPWFSSSPPSGALAAFLARAEGRKVLVVHPGARLPTKRWPKERFEELLARIALRGSVPVVVIAPPGESAPDVSGPWQLVVPTPDWADLTSTLAAADIVLCNDSLASHLAAGLGKRVLTIFGSGNPDWFAPFDGRAGVIATGVCPHRPCIDRCLMPSPVCLESLTVDSVECRLRQAMECL